MKLNSERKRRIIKKLLNIHGPVCKICNHKIIDYPTIDHKLARSLGGNNNINNLQLAHFLCNKNKGLWENNMFNLLEKYKEKK